MFSTVIDQAVSVRKTFLRKHPLRIESLEDRVLLAAGIGSEGESGSNAMPDFSLADVNLISATYNAQYSPRDLLGQTSAWYFAHFT
ncbi:hypothetical protein OAA19_01440 [Rubripirellula sp.]|nr:hypothetical protein [Rubripirellula sp.]